MSPKIDISKVRKVSQAVDRKSELCRQIIKCASVNDVEGMRRAQKELEKFSKGDSQC
jgi:hypothetical protein